MTTHAAHLAAAQALATAEGVNFASLTADERTAWGHRAEAERLADLRQDQRVAWVSLEFAPTALPDYLWQARRNAYMAARDAFQAAVAAAPLPVLEAWREMRAQATA